MANIISKIKRKVANGSFEDFFLGPEQKYVGALTLSGNNNLEEQLLIGENKIITSWIESDGTKRKTIEYRTETDSNNFYILEWYEYIGTYGSDYYVEDGNLHILDGNFFYNQGNSSLEESEYNSIIQYIELNNNLKINADVCVEKYELKYKNENNQIINISSKKIIESTLNNITTRKEIITNYL